MELRTIINAARGQKQADLVIKNANIINVFSGDIHKNDIAIADGRIVSIGDNLNAPEEIDINGAYLSPSFIDGHVHLESSMILPTEFAKAVIPSGTTTVIVDPHEISNVLGLQGISFIRETTKNLPLDVYMMLPSCVPATDMETSGSQLSSSDLSVYIKEHWVLGIAEMMNFPGVLNMDQEVMNKIKLADYKRVDGHAPGLSGKDLCAYIASGISSDHECTNVEEAKEKLRLGMYLMIREGTVAKDFDALIPVIQECNSRRCFFVTDDRYPQDLYSHISSMVKRAIEYGLSPVTAIQMATINTAEYFKISKLGAIAPGYKADMLVFENLNDIKPKMVFKNGNLVAKDSKILFDLKDHTIPAIRGSVNVKWIEYNDFKIIAESNRVKVIDIIPDQLITKCSIEDIKIKDEFAQADIEKDILKIAVIERHRASGNIGIGFVRGFGLRSGAIASTVAHDSHNMVVVGTNDEDMYYAAVELVKSQGGKIVVENGKTLEHLALPIAGLISNQNIETVIEKLDNLAKYSKKLGCKLDDPFMNMAFLSLPVIPELKITDKGLIDVNKFEITPVFV
ncbi:MAG: adenine deaminase [Candidatus Melainabacteria bacterium RIFOXYA12_FULL_32_12]|nr:MAG: adenine deaminase [Candidatus Melainabacteria bacterium RIFOXYA12_FULL_32_12]